MYRHHEATRLTPVARSDAMQARDVPQPPDLRPLLNVKQLPSSGRAFGARFASGCGVPAGRSFDPRTQRSRQYELRRRLEEAQQFRSPGGAARSRGSPAQQVAPLTARSIQGGRPRPPQAAETLPHLQGRRPDVRRGSNSREATAMALGGPQGARSGPAGRTRYRPRQLQARPSDASEAG